MNRLTAELIEYDKSRNFWTVARNDFIVRLARPKKSAVIMDVGCGSGILTRQLLKLGYKVISVDFDKDAVAYTKKVNRGTYRVDITKEIKLGEKAEVFILADVIEHIKKDERAIANLSRFMRRHDQIVISVPALQFFWTKNDEVRKHFRRYSKKELVSLLEKNGFKVKKIRYWNFLGIPPTLYQKVRKRYVDYIAMSQSWMNGFLLYYFLKVENKMCVPIGLSLVCVAEKV